MIKGSKACAQARAALQDCFSEPLAAIPADHPSLECLMQSMVARVPMGPDLHSTIRHLKSVSDAQEYRIQRSQLELESQPEGVLLQECGYELQSTGLLPQRSMFREEGHLGSIVDEVWWSAGRMEESFDFME